MKYEIMDYDAVEVAAIKIAVTRIERYKKFSIDVLLNSIVWLRETYERTEEREYLDKAVSHIYAFLQLGFPYEEAKEEIDTVLGYFGLNREDMFPEKEWAYKKVVPSKSGVRSLLGRWNAMAQSMKIQDAVMDIIEKVTKKQVGEYLYHCGGLIEQSDTDALWQHTFKLYVREDESIFHDMNNNKYYIFKEPEEPKDAKD